MVLNYSLDKIDLLDIYRMFHTAVELAFFSSTHGPFSRIDLDHKMNLNKFKGIKLYQLSFETTMVLK